MITENNQVFHLQTDHYSYLLRINAYGQPEHLHFGLPADIRDAEAFALQPGLGWGMSCVPDDAHTDSCPDDKALEWSDCGRGDYRESPLELCGVSTNLRFSEFEVLESLPESLSGLPHPHGTAEVLHLILAQEGLKLHIYYSVCPTALTRCAVLENTGSESVRVGKIMSSLVDLPGSYQMTSFHGGWIAEMRKETTAVTRSKTVIESLTGFSSNRSNPGFLLHASDATENAGTVYGFNLIYSGNHYAACQQSLQGLTRVVQGINPAGFAAELGPGESFETPEAVLCFSDHGFNGLSEQMHRFVNEHIIPAEWNHRMRPVLYNSWEGCGFQFDHNRLVKLAGQAKELGCELFVLDDGWFGARNDDHAGLGDYQVNTKKLPQGLKGLGDKLLEKGMEFGLWFEPEAVNPDSDLYRAHPEWALRDSHPDVLGRHQLLLDLTLPAVRDYIVENVSRTLDSAPIRYVKWDMNRHSAALGEKAHRYILGLYDILSRIFRPRPDILLESCSSGGNRFDLGMLCYSPQIWCSDNTDPIERLTIQGGLSYLYPQSTFGAHVSAAPHAQTLRGTPLATRGNVSFFGCLGYELDLKHLLPVEEKEIKAQIAFYKQYRPVFQYGTFRRTENGWQVSGDNITIAGVFHKLVSAAPGYEQLKVRGLSRGKRYRYASLEQAIRIGPFGSLMKHVLPVSVNPNGFLLHIADGRYTLPAGSELGTASGAALESGIMLRPQFRGTGYDTNQRTSSDFGSDIYVIEEINE